MDFKHIAYALSDIECTGSTLAKQKMLVDYGETIDGFKDVLKFIYDPYITTGIKQRKLDSCDIANCEVSASAMMEYLRTHNTGRLADVEIANAFIYADNDETYQWAATGLVTKDLKIGVSVTTLNKVFGDGFIPKIGIMRGMLCPDNANGTYLCTEKIDGNRRLIFVFEDGRTAAYTRSGHQDTGLVEILDEAKHLPRGYVYDCECVAMGDFKDSIALRQASASILNRGAGSKKTGVKALAFDMVHIRDYNVGISRIGGLGRKYMLAKTLGDEVSCEYLEKSFPEAAGPLRSLAQILPRKEHDFKFMAALPILGIAHNKGQAVDLAQSIWQSGGEGVMMLHKDAAYEVNPNPRKTLLKIKATLEFTLECTNVNEGTGKYIGMLGSVTVIYRNSYVDVGSGFTDWERKYYWDNPAKIIGKMVEIDSFGESTNQAGQVSLNCPIFKRIVGANE